MKFDISKNTHYTVLKLKERKLDISISPELKGEFILLCRPALKMLIVDLSDVEFCDRVEDLKNTVELRDLH